MRGDAALPGAIDAVEKLRRQDMPLAFCTQDAESTDTEIAARLDRMGFDIRADEIISCGTVAASHIKARYGDTPVHFVGTARQSTLLSEYGVQFAKDDDTTRVVLIGLYPGFSTNDFEQTCRLAWSGVDLLALARDRTFPTGDGLLPGTGILVKAVEHATRRRARILGKPSIYMAIAALDRLGLPAQATLVIGDNIDVDISMGKVAGCRTALVLSGSTSRTDTARIPARLRPDLIIDDVRALFDRPWHPTA